MVTKLVMFYANAALRERVLRPLLITCIFGILREHPLCVYESCPLAIEFFVHPIHERVNADDRDGRPVAYFLTEIY